MTKPKRNSRYGAYTSLVI